MERERGGGFAGNGAEDTELYSVGEVCDIAHITRKTLFYYDRIGLLTPTRREGVQHFKKYDNSKISRLKKIIEYREAGLNIAEVRKMLDDQETDHLDILTGALERLQKERADADERIRKLQRLIEREKE